MRARAASAMSLFALLLAVYLLAYSGEVQSSDELSMFCVTQSLATRGTTDTEAIRWMGLQPGTYGLDGRLYSKYGLGTSLAAVPLCALGRFLPIGLGAVQTTCIVNRSSANRYPRFACWPPVISFCGFAPATGQPVPAPPPASRLVCRPASATTTAARRQSATAPGR
jgi:hypothetical protein